MFNKYPYTDFHELNLDWVIKEIKRLAGEIDPLKADFEQIQRDFAHLESEVDNLLNTMEADIRRALAEYVPGYVDTAIEPYIAQLNDALAEVEDLKAQILGWRQLLDDMRADYIRRDDNLKVDYISRINVLAFDFMAQILRLDNRIDDLEFELPEIYNLVKGYKTNIAFVIYDVYDAVRYFAYTAIQYQNAGFTAQQLDDLERGALDLDVNGYNILYPPKKCLNPLTGLNEDICVILADLALFASERTWTALIWDGTWDRDADTIDALDITAFNFDYTDDADPNP